MANPIPQEKEGKDILGYYGKKIEQAPKKMFDKGVGYARQVMATPHGKIAPVTTAAEKSVIKRFRLDVGEARRAITKEQQMLQNLFHGEPTFGTGNNLPVINRRITSGGGIIKSGDINSETAGLFGF